MVGHLPRAVAKVQSPLLDNGRIAITGAVTRASTDEYRIPFDLYIYGAPQHRIVVLARLSGGRRLSRACRLAQRARHSTSAHTPQQNHELEYPLTLLILHLLCKLVCRVPTSRL